jgi:RNA polymerase sigma-70 factor (ECF subfamily)
VWGWRLPSDEHHGAAPLDVDFDQVLSAAQRGDEQAFRRLFRAVQPLLLGYLRGLVPDAAEDLAAETWLHVVRGLGRFTGDAAGFRGWVFTIAHHRWVDHRRAAARHPQVVGDTSLVDMAAPDRVDDLVEEALSTESALRLIGNLPPDQAEVILLRVVAGLDVAMTAAVVQKTPGAVRVLAHRGLRRLAQLVERPEAVRPGANRGREV